MYPFHQSWIRVKLELFFSFPLLKQGSSLYYNRCPWILKLFTLAVGNSDHSHPTLYELWTLLPFHFGAVLCQALGVSSHTTWSSGFNQIHKGLCRSQKEFCLVLSLILCPANTFHLGLPGHQLHVFTLGYPWAPPMSSPCTTAWNSPDSEMEQL